MAWIMSQAAVRTMAQSHTMTSRVDVLHGGRSVMSLYPLDGEVNAEANRPIMRNMSATLADPTGELSGSDVGDIMSPYDCELAPYRGVVVYPGTTAQYTEWTPLGVFQLTSRTPSGDGSVAVVGQDRALTYQGPMTGSLAIPGVTSVEDAIATLLATRNPGVQMRTWQTGYTCGPLLYQPDIDVWKAALDLAKSVGGWLYHDRTGALVFGPALPTSRRPVRRYAEGDGLLLDADRSEDSDTIHNIVVVTSAKAGIGGVIQAIAEDDDPFSPTYARGRYGRRPISFANQHLETLQQAQQVAATELMRELGRSETASIVVVPDLTLDPQDILTINAPKSGLYERGMVISSLTTPLTAEESMPIALRKSIIATDGQVMETSEELAST